MMKIHTGTHVDWLAKNMLNKNTQGAKNGEANQKQQLSDYE